PTALIQLVNVCLEKRAEARPTFDDIARVLSRIRSAVGSDAEVPLVRAPERAIASRDSAFNVAERSVFVGRDAESAELKPRLDRILAGHGGLVMVGGEPGVGKTRLAQELFHEAQQRGCSCLTGHCYEMEGAPPFVPFIELIEQAVRLDPEAERAAMDDQAPEI